MVTGGLLRKWQSWSEHLRGVADRTVATRTGTTAFVPYAPLAAVHAPCDRPERRRPIGAATALSWLLDQSQVVLPIPGTKSLALLEDNVCAVARL